MQCPDRELGVFLVDQTGNLDFGCADHENIDVLALKSGKGLGSNAGVVAHAHADDGHLGHARRTLHAGSANFGHFGFHESQRLFQILAGYCEGHVRHAFAAGRLDDHVHHDAVFGKRGKHGSGNAGTVGKTAQRYAGLIFVVCNAGDEHGFHHGILLSDQSSRIISKCGAHMDGNLVLLCELHRTDLQNLRPHGGHFEHFFVCDAIKLAG